MSLRIEKSLSPKTPLSPSSWFERIQTHIHSQQYAKAFDDLLFSLLGISQTEEQKARDLSQFLLQVFPHLEAKQIKDLLEKGWSQLSLFPQLAKDQFELCLELAAWSLKQPCDEPKKLELCYLQAMHYYGKALEIAKEHFPQKVVDIHRLASKLFMRIIKVEILQTGQFQQRLYQAKGKGDMQLFEATLADIERLKKYCCELEDDLVIKELYEQAKQVFLDTHFNKEFNTNFVRKIEDALVEAYVAPIQFVTQRYLQAFQNFRQQLLNKRDKELTSLPLDPKQVRNFQAQVYKDFCAFFAQTFLQDAFAILGPAPCHYDLRMMGSVAREEFCLYSDLEWMILIEEEKHTEYFKKLAQIVELQIITLGETAATDLPIFSCLSAKHRSGLHVDTGGNPAHADLIKTPQEMAKLQRAIIGVEDDPCQPHHSLRKTISLQSSDPQLERLYQQEMKVILSQATDNKDLKLSLVQQRALSLLQARLKSYKEQFAKNLDSFQEVNLKSQFVELLSYTLHDLASYYGIETLNTLDVIDELVNQKVLTKQSGLLLKQTVSQIYTIRWRLHSHYQEQKEEAYFSANVTDLKGYVLTKEEKEALSRAFWLVLYPLYQSLEKTIHPQEQTVTLFANLDLIEMAFRQGMADFQAKKPTEFLATFVSYLLHQNSSLEVHQAYYQRLSERTALDPMRTVYIQSLQRNHFNQAAAAKLAAIPNPGGYRQSYRMENESLLTAIQAMSTHTPSDVLLAVPGLGQLFLQPDLAKQILDSEGNIQRQYKDALHSVARLKENDYDLHFKQKPSHPMMEYAIANLTARLMGKSAPQTILARMEVSIKGKKKAYPVLISETIPGKSLLEVELKQLDQKQLSWLFICYILIRPGDGRLSNYVVDSNDHILCIDNDIAFVEPIVRETFSDTVQLNSILFCLEADLQLDKEVVQEFNQLQGDLIIHNWLEELIVKEKEYQSLFPDEKELTRLYSEDPKQSFTPSMLLRKGTVLTLGLQFTKLQEFLRHTKNPTALDLLEQLITVNETTGQNAIGPKIAQAYRKAIASSKEMKQRLKKATGSNPHQSMTSSQALKASLGKIPTAEEIEKKEKYSLQRAWQEVLSITGINKYAALSQEKTLVVDFAKLVVDGQPDLEHQEIILKGVQLFFESPKQELPEKITLSHCAVLETKSLASFLHPTLSYLDLRNCPRLTSSDVLAITKNCPNLKELYLSDCSNIKGIDNNTLFNKVDMEFPKLEILHIARSNIATLQLKAPQLRELKANQNSNLKIENIKISSAKLFEGQGRVDLRGCLGIDFKGSGFLFEKMMLWPLYFGVIPDVPPLPPNIEEILESSCPFWPDKKVKETHLLTLIPKTVNGKPLTLESIGELVKNPKQGNKTQFQASYFDKYEKTPVDQSHWVLMTRDVIPESRNKSYEDQLALVKSYNQKSGIEHEVPKLLDAAVCIFLEYVQRGMRLYPDNPLTYTRCQEKGSYGQMVVGDFSLSGLYVYDNGGYDVNGLSVLRKFSS